MRFGNTLLSIRGGIMVMALLGVLVGGCFLAVAVASETLSRNWPVGLLLAFTPPGVFFLACLPTLAFSIELEERRVRHLFLNRYVLSDLPVADFSALEIWKKPWGAMIHFAGGKKICFIGAHLANLTELKAALEGAKKRNNSNPVGENPAARF